MTESIWRRQHYLFFAGAIVLSLVAAACLPVLSRVNFGKNSVSSGGANVLYFDVPAPIGSLDPRDPFEAGGKCAFPLLYSRLFLVGADGRVGPELAVKWSYDPGELTWTIHLRRNAFFHDGRQVTAKDIAYSVERCSKEGVPVYRPETERSILLSETSIAFVLKWDDPDFLWKISRLDVLPADAPEWADSVGPPVGSGPFRFDYRVGEDEVRLVANEDYYFGRPSLDAVVFRYVGDRERSWARLLADRTDIATEIYPKDREMMDRCRDKVRFNERVVKSYALLLYNVNDPLFSDSRVRRALSHAVDTGYIVKRLLRGFGVPACGPAGVGSPYANEGRQPLSYDPGKSRDLLKDAGWAPDKDSGCLSKGGKRFEFTLSIFEGDQTYKRVAEYIQLCFNDLGIRAHIETLPFRELVRRYNGNDEFQAVITELRGAYENPLPMACLWTAAYGCGSNVGCFEDGRVTEWLFRALREKDPARRRGLVRLADARIVSLQPATFLYHKTALDVISGRILVSSPFSYDFSHIYQLKDARIAAP